MTTADLTSAASASLAVHLDAAYWTALAAASKTASLAMAADDVLARLSVSPESIQPGTQAASLIAHAIAEQALYLSRNYASQASAPAGRVTAAESIDGVSVSYSQTGSTESIGFSARAELYINRARKALLASLRLSRG